MRRNSKPNADNHNPNPDYLRRLIARSELTQQEVARRVGISDRMLRHYLMNEGATSYRAAPYPVQYALEQLALKPQ